jgi:hypothetical protein
MPSKSRKILNKRHDNLGLVTPHNKRKERVSPTCIEKDRENMDRLRTTSPSRKQRRKNIFFRALHSQIVNGVRV